MYMLTERLLSFNWQRFTLHKNEKKNLELYRKIPSSTNLLNYPRISMQSSYNTVLVFDSEGANSAGDIPMIFFSYFSENSFWHFMQIVSLTHYHTGPKVWTSSLLLPAGGFRNFWTCGNQMFCGVWSGFTLFAQACLSQDIYGNTGLQKYISEPVSNRKQSYNICDQRTLRSAFSSAQSDQSIPVANIMFGW